MASTNSQVTLPQVHEAIFNTVKAQFLEFKTVGTYVPVTASSEGAGGEAAITAPAFLLYLRTFERGGETGTEELAVKLRWEARVMGAPDDSAGTTSQEFASRVASAFEKNGFGLPVRGARFVKAEEDTTSSQLSSFKPWVVTFEQHVCLKTTEAGDDFALPNKIFVSVSPEIGLAYKDKYQLVYSREA